MSIKKKSQTRNRELPQFDEEDLHNTDTETIVLNGERLNAFPLRSK